MEQEIYKIKRPEHIFFGDPWYLERFGSEKLKKLVLDMEPPKRFEARLKLYRDTVGDIDVLGMILYLAPSKTMDTYSSDMMYEGQSEERRMIVVDTARYRLIVDSHEETIRTGGDGYWGSVTEFTRMNGKRKTTDAVVVDIAIPEDFYNFDEMRELAKRFFGNLEPVTGKDAAQEQEKPSIRNQLNESPPQEPKTDAAQRTADTER